MDKKTGMSEQRESAYSREHYAPPGAGAAGLLLIALLLVVLLPAALYASAHTPAVDEMSRQIYTWLGGEEEHGLPVDGLMEIEDVWEIEDTRTEAEDALIERMFCGDEALGYDRESRTFYCTIGTELGEDWPGLALSAVAGDGVRLALIDDYTYDYCADAVAEGYRYEMLAYSDTQYEYIGIVFTGLPVVTIHTDGGAAITTDADVGADIRIASAKDGALYSRAQIHRRGGGSYVGVPKHSYRFELRGMNIKGKEMPAARSVLGMEAESDWLLIGNASDPSAIRNHLCWQLWKDWKEERQIAELESRLVELFVDDEYAGIYQLMEYVNPLKELEIMGGNPQTDVMVRMVTINNDGDRPKLDRVDWDTHKLELRHAPQWMSAEKAFSVIDPFSDVEILRTTDMSDAEFTAIIEKHFDVRELIDYFLFIQMYGLTDNVCNNLYVWAVRGDDGAYVYHLSPWDMDQSLGSPESIINEGEIASWEMRMIQRMLDLDLGGCRQIMWDMFYEKRATVLSDDAIYEWLVDVEEEINATGAYQRETEKWRGGAQALDLSEMRAKVTGFQSIFENTAGWLWPVGGQE